MPQTVPLHESYYRIAWFTLRLQRYGFSAEGAVVPYFPFGFRKIIAFTEFIFIGWFQKITCPLNMCQVFVKDILDNLSIWRSCFPLILSGRERISFVRCIVAGWLYPIRSDSFSLSKLFSKLSFLTTFRSESRMVHTIIFECISIPVYVEICPS